MATDSHADLRVAGNAPVVAAEGQEAALAYMKRRRRSLMANG